MHVHSKSLDRNFSIIEDVARSQTKRSSSTAKRTMRLRLGGRVSPIRASFRGRAGGGASDKLSLPLAPPPL